MFNADQVLAEAGSLLSSDKATEQMAINEETQKYLETCLLGYGKINVVSAADGGPGPTLQTNTWNPRSLNKSHMESLTILFKEGNKKPFALENFIIVGISRQCLQNPASLSKDPRKLSSIQWSPEAVNQVALLLNGQHRLEANLNCLQMEMATIKTLRENMIQFNPEQAEKAKAQISKLQEIIDKESYWGVKLLDLGM